MLEVGVEQDDGKRTLVGVSQQVGIAHLVADDLRHFLQRPVVGGNRHAFPLAAGFDGDEREIALRADGAFELAVEHELKRAGSEELRSLLVKRAAGHWCWCDYEALSRPFSLIL